MKKALSLFFCILTVAGFLCTPAFATGNVVSFDDAYVEIYNADGYPAVMTRTALSAHTLPAYGAMQYFSAGGERFRLADGQRVQVSASLGTNATLQIGYNDGSGTTYVQTVTGRSVSASFSVPSEGRYSIVIKNLSSYPVSVLSGEIRY